MARILMMLLCIVTTAQPLQAQEAQDGYVRKPLAEIMQGAPASGQDLDAFPVYFTIPQDFVTFYGGDRVGILLATQPDINAMTRSGNIRDAQVGFFRIIAVPGDGYERASGKFSDESDPRAKDKLAAAGLTDCRQRRVDANGIPMLASTCMKAGRHTYMLHIAGRRPEDAALKVFYFHPAVHTARDEEVWSRFIGGLSGTR